MRHAVSSLALISLIQAPALAQHLTPGATFTAEPAYMPVAETGIEAELQTLIMDDFLEDYAEADISPGALMVLRGLYAEQLFAPLWTPGAAEKLVDGKRRLFDFGLVPDEISVADLQSLSEDLSSGSAETRALADLKLSVAWLRMASAVSGGLQDEGEAVSRPNRPSRSQLSLAIRDAARATPFESLSQFEPEHPQYHALKQVLQDYRQRADAGGWAAIPGGDTIEVGDLDARVPALRQRLAAEGFEVARPVDDLIEFSADLVDPSQTNDTKAEVIAEFDQEFDAGLGEALKEFQEHHGLEPDAVLGPSTLEALNERVTSKIDRIADALNRWREHGDLGERYVWANTPSFTAEAWDEGVRQFSMKTVVGMPSRETPTFSDNIEYVVTNPKWYAPVSIVRRDKLPKLQKDPSYAKRLNYQVYDRATGTEVSAASVNWADPESASKYRLVQSAGSQNALGNLKIIFPNQYSVYLHGTPSKALFDRAQRAFSSGCIRLEDPARMARWLARQDETVEVSDINEALSEGETARLDFQQTTPVHITYITVTVSDDGKPMFWRDIYDRVEGIEIAEKVAPLYKPKAIHEIVNDAF